MFQPWSFVLDKQTTHRTTKETSLPELTLHSFMCILQHNHPRMARTRPWPTKAIRYKHSHMSKEVCILLDMSYALRAYAMRASGLRPSGVYPVSFTLLQNYVSARWYYTTTSHKSLTFQKVDACKIDARKVGARKVGARKVVARKVQNPVSSIVNKGSPALVLLHNFCKM